MASQVVLSSNNMCSLLMDFLNGKEILLSLAHVNSTINEIAKEYFTRSVQGCHRFIVAEKECRALFAITEIVQEYAQIPYKTIVLASLLTNMKGDAAPSKMELSLTCFLKGNNLSADFEKGLLSKTAFTIANTAQTIFGLLQHHHSLLLCRKRVLSNLPPILKAVSHLSSKDRRIVVERFCFEKGINYFEQDVEKKLLKSLLGYVDDREFSKDRAFRFLKR